MNFIEVNNKLINLEQVHKISKDKQNDKYVISYLQSTGNNILPFENKESRDEAFENIKEILTSKKVDSLLRMI